MKTNFTTDNSQKNRYGLISMVAIVVGTVIGSGIYIKNSSLFEISHSAIYVTIGWLIGGLIVLSMFIAFIEIMSITTKRDEQGTFSNWARHLWGEKTSKYIGLYFIFFYFPLVIAVEAIFASNYFNELVFGKETTNVVGIFFFITLFAMFIVLFAFLLNSFFIKPGKIIQTVGTAIKIIPLFTIVIISILIIANGFTPTGETNEIFNPDAPINASKKGVTSIFLMIPAILFTLDGFLFAASTSKEAKKPSTYKQAAIISIIFIVIIYIMFSLGSLYLGEYNGTSGEGFSISGILGNIFSEDVARILSDVMWSILVISIVVATFGYAISSMWSLADFSSHDHVADKNGLFIRRNKVGLPYLAGLTVLGTSIIMVLYMRFFDGMAIVCMDKSEASAYVGMSDFSSNLFTTTNFIIYSILIFGALLNRFHKKTEVDKVRFFYFFSIIALLLMSLVVIISLYSIFSAFFDDSIALYITILQILIIITLIGGFIITTSWIIKRANSLTEKELRYKAYFKNAYVEHLEIHHYFNENNINLKIEEKYIREKLASNFAILKEKFKKWNSKIKDKENKDNDDKNDYPPEESNDD